MKTQIPYCSELGEALNPTIVCAAAVFPFFISERFVWIVALSKDNLCPPSSSNPDPPLRWGTMYLHEALAVF